MKEFDDLIDVSDTLMGPNGCPWDHEQTLQSLQPYILEEAHEILEAIDNQKVEDIVEELGDLFYIIIFAAKIGEKENEFTLKQLIVQLKDKMIRRHPHVFSDTKCDTLEEIEKAWADVKKGEKKAGKNFLPPSMPLILKAQKVIRKCIKKNIPLPLEKPEGIAQKFISLIYEAEKQKLDCEGEIRREISKLEKSAGESL